MSSLAEMTADNDNMDRALLAPPSLLTSPDLQLTNGVGLGEESEKCCGEKHHNEEGPQWFRQQYTVHCVGPRKGSGRDVMADYGEQ